MNLDLMNGEVCPSSSKHLMEHQVRVGRGRELPLQRFFYIA